MFKLPSLSKIILVLCLAIGLFSVFVSFAQTNVTNDDYLNRVSDLPEKASQEFVPDSNASIETELDKQPFDELLKLACDKVYDDPNTWGVTIRTAGRPFGTFDSVIVNGVDVSGAEPCEIGTSTITPTLLSDHYQAGKTTNRIWITHKSSEGDFPIVLVMTPDGFFNLGGARAPRLQGAAIRTGFIGEPFINEVIQHSDEVDIRPLDDGSLQILFNYHSEIGEGVALVTVTWDEEMQTPILDFDFSKIFRGNKTQTAGFAGVNFMKGETLSGKQVGGSEGPIAAFHDGLLGFVTMPDGRFERDWFTPPLTTSQIAISTINNVPNGSTLILDQLQIDEGYYSFSPTPSYGDRADFIVALESDAGANGRVDRYQKSVDLDSSNPEADETVNFFFEAEYEPATVYESEFQILVDSKDFATLYSRRNHGVAFVSETEFGDRIDFLPLTAGLVQESFPAPLTGQVLKDINNLDSSSDGWFLLFDADDYFKNTLNRIYQLDLTNGTVKRRTVDPFSTSSFDTAIGYGLGDNDFAMLTNRSGITRLNIESISAGLGSGVGNQIITAAAGDWCPATNQIFVRLGIFLASYDLVTEASTTYTAAGQTLSTHIKASPSCNQILFKGATQWQIYSVGSDSVQDVLSITGANPVWLDENTLIDVEQEEGGYSISLINLSTGEKTGLHIQSDPIGSLAYVPEIDSVPPTPTPQPPTPTPTNTLSPPSTSSPTATVALPTPIPPSPTPTLTPDPPTNELDQQNYLPLIFE